MTDYSSEYDDALTRYSAEEDRFHRPENYEKISGAGKGKSLWAGANDWESGWTWAGIHDDKDEEAARTGDSECDPVKWLSVNHDNCPGCKGTLDANGRKDAKECYEYGKGVVNKWAKKTGRGK